MQGADRLIKGCCSIGRMALNSKANDRDRRTILDFVNSILEEYEEIEYTLKRVEEKCSLTQTKK